MDNMNSFSNLEAITRRTLLGEYELRKKNKVVLRFRLWTNSFKELFCDVIDLGSAPLPIGLEYDGDKLLAWMEGRFIPKNRAFVEEVLEVVSGEHNRLYQLLECTFAMSLNDDYWIVSDKNETATWEEYNLYDNEFSKELSLVAFTGHGSNIVSGFVSSPEFTTSGMLRKSWRRLDDKVYLYKGGTEGYSNAGMEPYSEYFAGQVAEHMGLNHVKYDLEKWKGILCSTCELFTSPDESLVTYATYAPKGTIGGFLVKCEPTIYTDLVSLLVFDYIILNEDRHRNNFGFTVDNNQEVIGVAPIYDNGVSLLCHLHEDDLEDYESYIALRKFTYFFLNSNDIAVAKTLMEKSHKDMLRKLVGFELKQHDKYKVSDARLKLLNKVIQQRVKLLLS